MGSTKFPDGIDMFGDRSEPEMWHAENFHGRFGSTIITIISVIQSLGRARQIDAAAG